MGKIIEAVDMFCGAGGTSTGLMQAAAALGLEVKLTAINHWDLAVETHAKNHLGAEHLCESIEGVNPSRMFPGGRINLLVASPECIHHSNARGGVPCSEQSRATAWHITRWASALYIDTIIIENVKEFTHWGPLGADGKPLKSMKGKTFLAFKAAIESLGYRCEWRILNTANYGDATCRPRFFMICRRGNRRIEWPEQTHARQAGADLFGSSTRPWVPARDIIDWSIPGTSIFERKKPLSDNTLARIEAGLRKYGGAEFLVKYYGTNTTSDIDNPLPCQPFLLPQQQGRPGQLRTRSVNEPLPALATKGAEALVQPFITIYKGQSRTRGIDAPLPTITTNPHLYLAFLVKYYGTATAQGVGEPVGTITTKSRYALVEAFRDAPGLDIRFRMLQPHELAAAHSFPGGYDFAGTQTDIIKQIGNSVPVKTAQALCASQLRAA